MRFHTLAVRIDFMSRMGIWLWRAVSPIVASSPGQRPGDGVCIDLSIALCKSSLHYEGQRPVALRVTRLRRVAFLRHGAKMPNVLIAAYVSPGRCPGLWATFGLTARPNHCHSACTAGFVPIIIIIPHFLLARFIRCTAVSAAVSVRRREGPRLTDWKPRLRASLTSSMLKSPSGPMSTSES